MLKMEFVVSVNLLGVGCKPIFAVKVLGSILGGPQSVVYGLQTPNHSYRMSNAIMLQRDDVAFVPSKIGRWWHSPGGIILRSNYNHF